MAQIAARSWRLARCESEGSRRHAFEPVARLSSSPMTSTLEVSWLRGVPTAAVAMPRGSYTYSGTRIASSYAAAPLPRMPWAPPYSPWSDVNTTIVFACTWGLEASVVSTAPIWMST